MIVKAGEADRFARKPPKTLAAALVFGPDAGLVRERGEYLVKSVVPDINDPFLVAEFDEAALLADPARLADEAAALSMMGGRRVVRLRGLTNASAKIFEKFFADPKGDALIVAEGGDLAKGTGLRRIFEDADGNIAAIACYVDNERDLPDLVRSGLKELGYGIENDALGLAASRLGSDRGVTRQELEKLALYAGEEKTITTDHVQAVMGDESELRMEEALDAAGEGDFPRLDTALARLWVAGTSPIAVLRTAMSHAHRLLLVRAAADEGGDVAGAMRSLRPPVHFMRTNSFRAQAQRFNRARLEEGLNHLYEAEALAKTTGVPAEAVAARALFSFAALARQGR